MIEEGQIVLFRFPQTDLKDGKPRPALVIRKVPGDYDDWLICMISTRLYQQQTGLDEIISPEDEDFKESEKAVLIGKLGQFSQQRLHRIKEKITKWIMGS